MLTIELRMAMFMVFVLGAHLTTYQPVIGPIVCLMWLAFHASNTRIVDWNSNLKAYASSYPSFSKT